MGIVNQKIIQIINEIIALQGHDCFINEQCKITDCEPIKTHPSINNESEDIEYEKNPSLPGKPPLFSYI